jgi:hypothetical protein
MTPPRLPLVKAQRSFLSGIRLSREQHGPKVKVTAPPIKKRKFRTLGVLPVSELLNLRRCDIECYSSRKVKRIFIGTEIE